MGRVVTRTFRVFGENLISFSVLGTLAVAPQMFLAWRWVDRAFTRGAPDMNLALRASFERLGVFFIVSVILGSILQAALVHGTIATMNGKSANIGECLATGLKSLPKVVGIGFLEGIIIIFGMVLLIVPGIIAAMMLCVAVPAGVVEDKPILDSLSRSAALTSGHRWAIFGLFIAAIFVSAVAGVALSPLAGLSLLSAPHSPLPVSSAYWIANTIVKIVETSLLAVLAASIYYELRTIKEGVGPEELAAVFA